MAKLWSKLFQIGKCLGSLNFARICSVLRAPYSESNGQALVRVVSDCESLVKCHGSLHFARICSVLRDPYSESIWPPGAGNIYRCDPLPPDALSKIVAVSKVWEIEKPVCGLQNIVTNNISMHWSTFSF